MVKEINFNLFSKKVQISISNKLFYFLVVVGVLVLMGIGVYAYHSGVSPSVMGHGVNEIDFSEGPVNATGGLIIETRTSDPPSSVSGQMWLRTDL